MVCTSQPLAAQAGLDILKKGGNAVDAAIATAACMTVLEPTSNGIGGDGFALVWMKDKLYGLNASGPAPMGIDPEELRAKYGDTLPKRGWVPVTVPGIPSAWASLSERFGKLPFEAVSYTHLNKSNSPQKNLCLRQRFTQSFVEACRHLFVPTTLKKLADYVYNGTAVKKQFGEVRAHGPTSRSKHTLQRVV